MHDRVNRRLLVAFATATVASRFVATVIKPTVIRPTVIKQGAGMGTSRGFEHVLVRGWSRKGPDFERTRADELVASAELTGALLAPPRRA